MASDRSEYQREYYLKNREKLKQRSADYYEANKERVSERDKLKFSDPERRARRAEWQREYRKQNREHVQTVEAANKYGITYEQAKELRSTTNCQICNAELGRGKNAFAIDHCHETGSVRGVLCGHCNKGLGMFRDDPSLLQSAIMYLGKPKLFNG